MVRIYAGSFLQFVLHTWTQALRQRRHWLIAASTMDWSKCNHSIFTKMQIKIYPLLFSFSVEIFKCRIFKP